MLWGWQAECGIHRDSSQALCSSLVQPKPICSEGVESLKHKQEGLSKKASSVLLCWSNHVKKTKKASAPAKEQALTLTASELPPHHQPSKRWHGAPSSGPCTLCDPIPSPGARWQSSSESPPLTHPAALCRLPRTTSSAEPPAQPVVLSAPTAPA